MTRVVHITAVDNSIRFLLLNQLLSLKSEGYDVCAACRVTAQAPYIESRGIPVHPIQVSRRVVDPLADLKTLIQLVYLVRKHRFTIVHAHTPKISLLGQLAARISGVPIVLQTLHGFQYRAPLIGSWQRRLYKTLETVSVRLSDCVLSVAREDVRAAIDDGLCASDKIAYVGNGIDLNKFRPCRSSVGQISTRRRDMGIPDNARVVGIVGRYVLEKGYLEFFQAAKHILTKIPNAYFVTLGVSVPEKPDAFDPDELTAEFGLQDRAVNLGFRYDMPDIYEVMDILVLPSHREGLPYTLLEGAAMGLPLVATDVRGCREVVIDGENGLLVPVRDSQVLAEAILTLLRDPKLARQMGQRGRAIAEERFDERAVFEKVKATYRRLLKEKGYLN